MIKKNYKFMIYTDIITKDLGYIKVIIQEKKKINYFPNLLSLTLASVGVITGGITCSPIFFRSLTTAGILLKSLMEMNNYKGKIDLIKFGFTSYEKVLINLRTAIRGGEFDYKKFISEIKMLHAAIIVLSPNVNNKLEKRYNIKYVEAKGTHLQPVVPRSN